MSMIRMAKLLIGVVGAGFALPALTTPALAADAVTANAVTDCPMARAPYSIDSPLIDVLINPEAKAAAAAELGESFTGLTPFLTGTKAPTFSAIVTLRGVLSSGQAGPPKDPALLARLDARLHKLPVTRADQLARCARYDNEPADPRPSGKGLHVLVFEKINGFLDAKSVGAAREALQGLAQENGWSMQVTDKGGAIQPEVLARYDLVVWNNISGDALTLTQRRALKDWIEHGGGFVGVHGAAGDPATFWDWYTDHLVGAAFLGHPANPQFRPATLHIEGQDPVTRGIPAQFTMTDEWYSFRANPRLKDVRVLATLDEASYDPPANLRMGADHPIAWKHCVGRGRAFYSAIGHPPSSFADANYRRMLTQAVEWAGKPDPACAK
ncbi:ThuA domain-containing protein [Novosphingobium sp. SG707]|uniref:ThuA domain-containing protein n=1 Tax=Novosphingobium sp. SG707 TaxID=2586996 RepID=UPI001FF0BE39|nr:ThuA domain-containing protein [Novosphingobium sp. SG707]